MSFASSLVPCPRTSRKHSEPRKKTFLVLSPSQPRPAICPRPAIASLQLMTRTSVAAYSRRRQRFLPSYIGTYISTVLRNASHLRDCHDPLQKTRCSPTPELQATLLPNILGPLNSRGRVPVACCPEPSCGISRGLTCHRGIGSAVGGGRFRLGGTSQGEPRFIGRHASTPKVNPEEKKD